MSKPNESEVRDAQEWAKQRAKKSYKLSDREAEKVVKDAYREQEKIKNDKK